MSLKLRTLVLGLLLSFCSLAVAQTDRDLVAVGFTPQQASALITEFGTAVGQSLAPSVGNTYDLGSESKSWKTLYAGTSVIGTASAFEIATNANTKRLQLGGGTSAAVANGANIYLYGVGAGGGTLDGDWYLRSGDVATGGNGFISARNAINVQRNQSGYSTLWTFNAQNGALTSDATNGGDLVFGGNGDTVSIQEATAASACMGQASPNGTTPVAVTTTCATSGSRIFFTRRGTVTNKSVLTVTTAPSGSGFSFASTGASDTEADSVVYLIVKESA